jgi:hypothetical protein
MPVFISRIGAKLFRNVKSFKCHRQKIIAKLSPVAFVAIKFLPQIAQDIGSTRVWFLNWAEYVEMPYLTRKWTKLLLTLR